MINTHLKSPNPCVSVLKKSGSLTDLETDSSSVSLPHTSLPKHLNLDLRRKPRRVWVGFHARSLWHLCWDCQQGGQLVPASKDRCFPPCGNDTCPLKLGRDPPIPWVPVTAQVTAPGYSPCTRHATTPSCCPSGTKCIFLSRQVVLSDLK